MARGARTLPLQLPQPTAEELNEGSQAIGEAAAMAAGIDLSDQEKLNQRNDLLRVDNYESHVHRLTICSLHVIFWLSAIMLAALVSQYVLPERWRLLSNEDAARLQAFLFSGALGSFVTGVWKREAKAERRGGRRGLR